MRLAARLSLETESLCLVEEAESVTELLGIPFLHIMHINISRWKSNESVIQSFFGDHLVFHQCIKYPIPIFLLDVGIRHLQTKAVPRYVNAGYNRQPAGRSIARAAA